VSSGIWEKAGALTTAEWEQVACTPTTPSGSSRVRALSSRSRGSPGCITNGMDGSGYHHRASAAEVPTEARVLAAADVYQAMTQGRQHRPARSPDEAAETLTAEARAGRLDAECVRAVLEAAGGSAHVRGAWPAGLTDREMEHGLLRV
jgi:hypothetical protein